MKLQTQIPIERQVHNVLDYNSKVLLLGSCFAENIGEKFEYFKFQNFQNPFGVLFHPKAIKNFLELALSNYEFKDQDVFKNNDQWYCFDAHSKLTSNSKAELLNKLNVALKETSQFVERTSHVIITLGTAWVYRLKSSEKIVANCHKIPQKEFEKELLSIDAVKNTLVDILNLLFEINPKVQVLFTVSPVRHVKDGFIENTLSKSHLISAIHEVIGGEKYRGTAHYFPSYEIMMDELRDYRFYKDDMLHPSDMAVDYIWERFKTSWISESDFKIMKTIDDIQKGLNHKAFNENSAAHRKFLEGLRHKINEVQTQLPQVKFLRFITVFDC